jgi:hypothetical protein
MDEAPFQPIISFLKINLEDELPNSTLFSMHGMKELLSNNDIINPPTPRNKSRLVGRKKITKQRSNPVNNSLSNHLIDRVTKANGPKMTNCLRPTTLGNQSNAGRVQVIWHLTIMEHFNNLLCNRIPNLMPTPLKEPRMKPIRARGLKRFHRPKAKLNLTGGTRSLKR